MTNVFLDLRYALRQLRQSPGFAFTAIFTLALGIGISAAIFSVADAVLLRPLSYPHPNQLMRVWEQTPTGHRLNLAESNFQDFLSQNQTFASLAAYSYGASSISGGSEPARVIVSSVTSGFFPTLGAQPFRGRVFTQDEQRAHGTPAIIVSYSYWQRYLGSDANLSKFQLDLDGGSYPVVGVMPPGFNFPLGGDVWIPRDLHPPDPTRTAHNWRVIGRVRDGVTVAQARSDLETIAHRIRNQYGRQVDLTDAAVVPLADVIVGPVRTTLLTLSAGVGLLLLIACGNVTGLLLAQTSARGRELAVRAALGAGHVRLIQQFLCESFVLSVSGGALGLLIAAGGVRLLPAILPENLPRKAGIAMNLPVILFGLGVSVGVAVALGFFTAWRASRGDMQHAINEGSRSHAGSRASQRLRNLLVIGEIAITLVIVVGAGLLGRSFMRLIATTPGFQTESLVTVEFSPPIESGQNGMDQAAIARQVHQFDDIQARLRAIPGATSVGLAGGIPVAAGDNLPDGTFLILNGRKPPANFDEFNQMALNHSETGHALYSVASEGYFQTLGIPLIHGRIFGEQDTLATTNVALISNALAHQQWPNQDPIGQTIEFGNMDGNLKPLTIVGIVGDVRAGGLDGPPSSIIYLDYAQRGMNLNSTPTFLVRSAVPESKMVFDAREIFHQLAPQSPVKFSTFATKMGGWLANRRFLLILMGLYAATALCLAAVGIYGLVAFFVASRTQEIGVRMAVGAERGDVLRLVLFEGARLAAFGISIGILVSLALTRLLSGLLFGISTTDPLTFAGVAIFLCVVAIVASYLPARRAASIDPLQALRGQ